MGGVVIGFAIIAFVIAVGYVAGRLGIGGPQASFVLNRIAFFVTNPALLFVTLARADLHVVFSAQLLISGVAAISAAGLFVLLSRLFFRRGAAETTIGALGAGYVNANNIGLPVAVYVLGSATYVAPVLLLQLIVFAPIALTVLDITSRSSVSVRSILTQPVRNPMIIASVLGILINLSGLRLPDAVFQPFVLLGGAAVPLVLMAFGMSLHGSRPLRADHGRIEIITASVIKAAVMPLIAFLVAWLGFGMHGHALFAAVALAALPAAQNVYNFAARYERGMTVARDVVLLTTLFAVPALLLIAALLA
ncbi:MULTISPECIES: AEC family transporter [unclassified Leifsonia]|uniref:AEC family transporter n=1 Tax=unclassified Leifsonia TaxID=2663824 RepID=UPI000A19235F|nr:MULTISPECIES: AEC family transporter [unclassified Leifsonia]QJA00341.1 AEC family transporter [Leifsonia sp. PS1209]